MARFNRQPVYPARIDRGNPITRGLVLAVLPIGGAFIDVVSGQIALPTGTSRYRKTINGNQAVALSQIGSGSGAAPKFLNPTGLDAVAGAFTIFCEGSLEVNASTQDICKSWETGAGLGVGISFDDTATVINGWCGRVNNSTGSFSPASGILGANSETNTHRVAVAADGTNHYCFGAGALQSTTASVTLPTASANRRTYLLNGFDPTTGSSSGSFSILLAWNRAISAAEYLELYNNPWQVFQAFSSRLFAPPAAASGFFSRYYYDMGMSNV